MSPEEGKSLADQGPTRTCPRGPRSVAIGAPSPPSNRDPGRRGRAYDGSMARRGKTAEGKRMPRSPRPPRSGIGWFGFLRAFVAGDREERGPLPNLSSKRILAWAD